ncbi:MAG: excinuclease ABC subunit UvrA [Pirellulales bacterium]|nr:excinuclease ABC subunit UvrA [Pirellulales bacterium]
MNHPSQSPDAAPPSGSALRLRGARTHNLKNLDVDIPRDRLVVITGPSGSGKSSLAFDTLFAEGQRQYLESVSISARKLIQQLERPDIDWLDGLQPTLAIDQRAGNQNPRSTVGTITEIYDFLRVLFARLGVPHCPRCQIPIRPRPAEEIERDLTERPVGTKLMLLAPRVLAQKGKHLDEFEQIRKAGFLRARVDGAVVDIDPPPELNPRQSHTIEAVIDRIIIREQIQKRLAESLRLAIDQGNGAVIVCELPAGAELVKHPDGRDATVWTETLFSTLSACPGCQTSYPEIEPRSFSFGSPQGACPDCQGLGNRHELDPRLVLPDETRSLADGACAAWRGLSSKRLAAYHAALQPWLDAHQLALNTPLADYPASLRGELWRGVPNGFIGLKNLLEQEYVTTLRPARREELAGLRAEVRCPGCDGSRLQPLSRAVRWQGITLPELISLACAELAAWFDSLDVPPRDRPVFEPLAREITSRLAFLRRVGLSYLTLSRPASTLSGGELQRVRLATSIGSGLVGVCYILDEPSIGLHPRDNEWLIESLRDLQTQGNSVIVVEHDAATMLAADYLIDMGPGAGVHGGRIVSLGTPDQVCADAGSLTGGYLSGRLRVPRPRARRPVKSSRQLVISGCRANNLQNLDVTIPLGLLVCVTGVSGSGKSTLINGTLAREVARQLHGATQQPGEFDSLRGVRQLERIVRIDQQPIGRTARSTPATYCGLLDEIRRLFALTKLAKQRGYRPNRFSFNVKGGRCEDCQGLGERRVAMSFLPDALIPCAACQGTRYNAATREVFYRGHSIDQVLELSCEAAAAFFANVPLLAPMLTCLCEVGLGYLTLGQSGGTLSGGEAQRIKLAAELGRGAAGKTLFVLDEPTTGLHFADIARLLEVLQRLVDAGHTVLVIEHNVDVMLAADYLIDLGPEGGAAGGRVVVCGTPEEVATCDASHTGRHLHQVLAALS